MQALMLAAGMGKRLKRFTNDQTKCMVKVGEKTLLQYTVEALQMVGIKRFVIVDGYQADKLEEYIKQQNWDMEFVFIRNEDYAVTNNIYSLYLAADELQADDTILLESDLIYEPGVLRRLIDEPAPNVVVVAKYQQWMDGTVTLLDENGTVKEFVDKSDFHFEDAHSYYKTVNIYKFSADFSTQKYRPFLDAYIHAYGKNRYYEQVLKALAHLSHADLKALVLETEKWYEIDDAQDLDIANTLFSSDAQKFQTYEKHFGGYWRFEGLRDFCYLVNPYFPPQKMLDQMRYFFEPLLREYPSGMGVQKLIAGKMFDVLEDHILVGNGAAELIGVLGRCLSGKVALSIPTFNEYIRCFPNCEICEIPAIDDGFQLNKDRLIELTQTCDAILLINPDNPSGSFLKRQDLMEILEACKARNVLCIVDESFADFADPKVRYTLIDEAVMAQYPQLVIMKSISKSYGVPGIRLGVVASSNKELLGRMKEILPIWNINSYGEYFMQIFGLYASQYEVACDKIAEQRDALAKKLASLSFLQVYPSQANYIMCRVTSKFTANELAVRLINEYNLLIKDLTRKKGFCHQEYIRIAVKDAQENRQLYEALRELDT